MCSGYVVDGSAAQCSDGRVGDEEELQPARPLLSHRLRVGALLLAAFLVGALLAVREWPRSVPTRPPVAVPSTALATRSPWPTAPGACNNGVDLPIVSSTVPAESTGIKLLLGGPRLRTVDFDSGHATVMSQVNLRPGEFVIELAAASQTYAVTGVCATGRSRLFRIGGDGTASVVTQPGPMEEVLADGTHAWGVSFPTPHDARGYLVPLDGGRRVRLPASFYPSMSVGGLLIGILPPETGPALPASLLLVDATTGDVRANLGKGRPIAAGSGLVLWTEGCDLVKDKPCTLHSRSIRTGTTAIYRLPRPAVTAVVSPDGRLLALTLERATRDARFGEDQSFPPSAVAILHLDTGQLEIVPGIEAPPNMSPALAFSADGRWLVIALDAGVKSRLLAWRSGLDHPYESTPISGLVWGAPPILVLPARAAWLTAATSCDRRARQ
jgi:hypothetical protein